MGWGCWRSPAGTRPFATIKGGGWGGLDQAEALGAHGGEDDGGEDLEREGGMMGSGGIQET